MHVLFNHNLSSFSAHHLPLLSLLASPRWRHHKPPPSPPLPWQQKRCQEFYKKNSTIASQVSNAFPQFSHSLLKKQRKKKQSKKRSKISTLFSTFPALIPLPLLNHSLIPPPQLQKKKITTLIVLSLLLKIPITLIFQISQISSLLNDSSSLHPVTPIP